MGRTLQYAEHMSERMSGERMSERMSNRASDSRMRDSTSRRSERAQVMCMSEPLTGGAWHGTASPTLLPSRPALSRLRESWLLSFEDESLEHEFAAVLDEQNRGIAKLMMILVLIFLAAFFILGKTYELFDKAFASGDAVAVTMLLSQSVVLFYFPACLFFLQKGVEIERLVLWAGFVGSTALFMNNDYRMSKVFHSSFWEDQSHACLSQEGVDSCCNESLLVLPLVFITMCTSSLTRSSRSWPLPLWQVSLYGLMSSTRDIRPSTGTFHLLVGILLTGVCWLAWSSRRQAEVWVRLFWIDNRFLRLELARKEEVAIAQERRLIEVNDCLEAMGAGPGLNREEAFARVRTEVEAPSQGLELPSPRAWCIKSLSSKATTDSPNPRLEAAMAGRQADAARIRKMAERIRDESYGLKEFCDDCLASFPELDLYFTAPDGEAGTGSGRSGEWEYQRTIGALFSLYWLLRLSTDGKHGFCFGVDDNWNVKTATMGRPTLGAKDPKSTSAKRHEFFYKADWNKMQELVNTSVAQSVERIEAMLCFSAIHDVMKMTWLLPVVTMTQGPYRSHAVGSVIYDHDLALSYIIECYPHLLPSYNFLSSEVQEVILFSVSKMQFNHGWFVQAEAPPGPMLGALKTMLSASKPGDFYFYFLHWLTDLSGAEGTPKGGAEKLVVKFPMPVLRAFLWSIPYLQELHDKTETAAFEDYLAARWQRTFPNRELPVGDRRIALLRLTVMAQTGAALADSAFLRLPLATQTLLSIELARTGTEGQLFTGSPVAGGPALLVYYGPALLQPCQDEDDMYCALSVLAAVFEGGRQLWPESLEKQNETVVVNIASLKAHSIRDIAGCPLTESKEVWALVQKNQKEAMVELLNVAAINDLNDSGTKYWILELSVQGNPDATPFSESRLRTIAAARRLLERVLWL